MRGRYVAAFMAIGTALSPAAFAADLTGTNGNDVFFFQGDLQNLNLLITNPWSGATFLIDGEVNGNTASYEGLAGIDTLYMTNFGDALFVENPIAADANGYHHAAGDRMVFHIEAYFAGGGSDVIDLASDNYALGDLTVVDAGNGDDLVWSSVGNDFVKGREGNDIIDGGPGNDRIYGGGGSGVNSGDDVAQFGASFGQDYFNGEDGADTAQFFGLSGLSDLSFQLLDAAILLSLVNAQTDPANTGDVLVSLIGSTDTVILHDVEFIQLGLDSPIALSDLLVAPAQVPLPPALPLFAGAATALYLGGRRSNRRASAN